MVTLKFNDLSERQLDRMVNAAQVKKLETRRIAGTNKFEIHVPCRNYEESQKIRQELSKLLLPDPADKTLAYICIETEFEVYKILNHVLEMFFGFIAEAAGNHEIQAPLWLVQKNIYHDRIELKLTLSEDKLLAIISKAEEYLLKLRTKTEKSLEACQDYYKKALPITLAFSSAGGSITAGKDAQQEFNDLLRISLQKQTSHAAQNILNMLGKELMALTEPTIITITDPEDLQAILHHMIKRLVQNGQRIDQALKLLKEAEIVIEIS